MAGGHCSRNAPKNGRKTDRTASATAASPLHRLGEVRRQEGISRRTLARRLGVSISELKLQEQKTSDLPLSKLYEWQKALKVPLVEMLVEPDDSLSPPLMQRGQLVRLMKTAVTMVEQTKETSIKRMARTLIAQLTEIMPELREISSWPVVGQRRRRNEYGQAAARSLPEEMFTEPAHDTTLEEWA